MSNDSKKYHSKHAGKKPKHVEPEKKEHKLISNERYEKELEKLEYELVKLQEWVKLKKLKVAVLFEGRDAAGKGGVRFPIRLSYPTDTVVKMRIRSQIQNKK